MRFWLYCIMWLKVYCALKLHVTYYPENFQIIENNLDKQNYANKIEEKEIIKSVNQITKLEDVSSILKTNTLPFSSKSKNPTYPIYGLIYSPYRDGRCPTQSEVDEDIQLLSPLTTRLHLYGMDCNQTQLIISSVKRFAPNMELLLGMWIRNNRFENELSSLLDVIKDKENHRFITGICVGNEELYTNSLTKEQLIHYINVVRKEALKNYMQVPIFTTDVPRLWDKELADVSDILALNIHPYFDHSKKEHLQIPPALRVIQQVEAFQSLGFTRNKPIIIGETGWPKFGTQTKTSGIPSVEQQTKFFSILNCLCKLKNIPYYFFEAYDSAWKDLNTWGGVERSFGIFDNKRKQILNFNDANENRKLKTLNNVADNQVEKCLI